MESLILNRLYEMNSFISFKTVISNTLNEVIPLILDEPPLVISLSFLTLVLVILIILLLKKIIKKIAKNSVENMKTSININTSMGNINVELYGDKAPISVKNFLEYVDSEFYSGTIFHRVVPDFMIQGGGFTEKMSKKAEMPPIENEAENGLKNQRGTIVMARSGGIDSATSQFFINVKNNHYLNHKGMKPKNFGYAVFGKVVEGMDIVDKISKAPTEIKGEHRNCPTWSITIDSIDRAKS